jgi:hypothetical protein
MATLIQEGTEEQIRKNVDWNDMHTCYKGYNKPVKNKAEVFSKPNLFFSLGIYFLIKSII